MHEVELTVTVLAQIARYSWYGPEGISFSLLYSTIDANGGHQLSIFQGKTPDKMAAFSVVRKKTPFQKHREEEDAKKKVTVD